MVEPDEYGFAKSAFSIVDTQDRITWLKGKKERLENDLSEILNSEKPMLIPSQLTKMPNKLREDIGDQEPSQIFRFGGKAIEAACKRHEIVIVDALIAAFCDLEMIEHEIIVKAMEMDQTERFLFISKSKTSGEVTEKLKYFTDEELPEIIDDKIKVFESGQLNVGDLKGKIYWSGSAIELITLFYDMYKIDLIRAKTNKTDIARLISNFFVVTEDDNLGRPVSYDYALKILKDFEPKASRKANFDKFLDS